MYTGKIRDNIVKTKLLDIFGATIGNLLYSSGILASMEGKSGDEKFKIMIKKKYVMNLKSLACGEKPVPRNRCRNG